MSYQRALCARRSGAPNEHHVHDAAHAVLVEPPQGDKPPTVNAVGSETTHADAPHSRKGAPDVDQLDQLWCAVWAARHNPWVWRLGGDIGPTKGPHCARTEDDSSRVGCTRRAKILSSILRMYLEVLS